VQTKRNIISAHNQDTKATINAANNELFPHYPDPISIAGLVSCLFNIVVFHRADAIPADLPIIFAVVQVNCAVHEPIRPIPKSGEGQPQQRSSKSRGPREDNDPGFGRYAGECLRSRFITGHVDGCAGMMHDTFFAPLLIPLNPSPHQTDLVKVRQSYAEITATQRRLLKQKEQSDALANDWYKRAQLALSKGEEGLAKEALSRRQQQTESAESLQMQINTQAQAVDKLYEGMQALEAKILEAKSKKEQMVARARTAQSTAKVNDMLGGITGKTSMDAFKRMEDKVEALEAAAEVSAEMGSFDGKALPGSSGGSVEAQFRLLEASTSVDRELEEMKKMLGTTSSATKSDSMDDELERLKREAGL